MVAPVEVNVNVNTNLDYCCPRKVRIICCCCKVDDEDERVRKVAQPAIERHSDTDSEDDKT